MLIQNNAAVVSKKNAVRHMQGLVLSAAIIGTRFRGVVSGDPVPERSFVIIPLFVTALRDFPKLS